MKKVQGPARPCSTVYDLSRLRAGLKPWAAFKFWRWNEHSKVESLLAIGAAYVFALAVYVLFGV